MRTADAISQPTESLHRTRADVIAANLRRLARRAHLDQRHIDAALGKIHRQSEADRSTPYDQLLGIDPLGHEHNGTQQAQRECLKS